MIDESITITIVTALEMLGKRLDNLANLMRVNTMKLDLLLDKDTSSTKNEVNSQENKTKQSLPMTAKVDRHSSLDKLDKTPDIHSQNKELMDKDYSKTNKEVRT